MSATPTTTRPSALPGADRQATFEAFRRALARRPLELVRGLAGAARGRHVQVYSRDPAGQQALLGLGVGGSAAAPDAGD